MVFPAYRNARSHYVLTSKSIPVYGFAHNALLSVFPENEVARGIANRFVHSRTYIFLYLGMACLSATTVGLSLAEGCPGLAFYILEIIVNSAMIVEVGVRLLAFGKARYFAPSPGYSFTVLHVAILEISIQHLGPHPDVVLCTYTPGPGLCGLRLNVQGGGTARHATAGCSQCPSICTSCSGNATVGWTESP